MKSLNTKLVLSALGLALVATPAFAQRPRQVQQPQAQFQTPYNSQTQQNARALGGYPNPQIHSGSEESHDSGLDTIGGGAY